MMAEGTFELHPGDALYPEIVLELSDVPQTVYVRGHKGGGAGAGSFGKRHTNF